MRIERLELTGFRNYASQTAEFDRLRNVLAGENAQGKTNLLEALAYLSRGKSPRARTDRELIGFDAPAARLEALVDTRGREYRLEAELYRDRRRRLRVNKVTAKSASALSQVLNTVLFQPEDLYLIREGAAARRRFFDAALCQLRPRYAAALSSYKKALEQKTRILRDCGDYPALLETLPEFNEQMIRAGAALVRYRARFIRRLDEIAAAVHRDCSGGREALSLRYQSIPQNPEAEEGTVAEELRTHMEAHAAAERAARQCLSGPHKDDLLVYLDGREAKAYASQGQTRTAALSLKLAEREIYKNAVGEYPVLLLDDVLSELDPRRQEFVLNRIEGGQVFITCCEEDRLTSLLGGKVLLIRGGTLYEERAGGAANADRRGRAGIPENLAISEMTEPCESPAPPAKPASPET